MQKRARAGQQGFSFIEILVVMGIISVLVSMVVVVVPRIQEEGKRTKSRDNVSSIAKLMMVKVTEKGWKYFKYNGKNFTLAIIATGDVDKRQKANLNIFFSPGDPILTLDSIELDRYKAVTKEALRRGGEGFDELTSYAGRRNADPDYLITADEESMGTLILADDDQGPVHHKSGFVAAYSNGRVAFHEWEDFEGLVEPEDPRHPDPWLGEDATNKELEALSSN